MNLVILHGPAQVASRKKLTELRQKFNPNNVVVFEKGSDPQEVLASLQTVSMFQEDRLIIWENPSENRSALDTKRIASSALDTKRIASSALDTKRIASSAYTLILWFDHEIKTKYEGETYVFPEAKEVSVFSFLDLLGDRDKKAYLELDKLKEVGFETQYFITMIFYLLRNLVVTPKNSHDFVKRKNAKMRANFSSDELVQLYKFVLETDFKIKKGLMDNGSAQFLLVSHFCNLG